MRIQLAIYAGKIRNCARGSHAGTTSIHWQIMNIQRVENMIYEKINFRFVVDFLPNESRSTEKQFDLWVKFDTTHDRDRNPERFKIQMNFKSELKLNFWQFNGERDIELDTMMTREGKWWVPAASIRTLRERMCAIKNIKVYQKNCNERCNLNKSLRKAMMSQ